MGLPLPSPPPLPLPSPPSPPLGRAVGGGAAPGLGGWVEGLPRGGVAGETGPSQPFLDQRHLLM